MQAGPAEVGQEEARCLRAWAAGHPGHTKKAVALCVVLRGGYGYTAQCSTCTSARRAHVEHTQNTRRAHAGHTQNTEHPKADWSSTGSE